MASLLHAYQLSSVHRFHHSAYCVRPITVGIGLQSLSLVIEGNDLVNDGFSVGYLALGEAGKDTVFFLCEGYGGVTYAFRLLDFSGRTRPGPG